MARLFSLWRNLVDRNHVNRDLDEEVRAAFELLVDEKVGSGMHPDDARRAARLELGGLESLKDGVRDVRAGAGVDSVLQDIRYAFRVFQRAPGFTAVAVVTLALGIGANAAVFGVLKSVLLDGLPYPDADRLVRVYGRSLDGSLTRGPLSAAAINDIAARQQSLNDLAVFQQFTSDAVYGGDDVARSVKLAWVGPSFFESLGVPVALGRTFRDDERTSGLVPLSFGRVGPDTARSVVVAHTAWQRLLTADPNVLGRVIAINGIPRTVIGVLPRDFVGPMGVQSIAAQADFYLAFDLNPVLANPNVARGAQWLGLIGRLKPGLSFDVAEREIAAISVDLAKEYPKENGNRGLSAMPLRDAMVGNTRTPLLVLMASAAFVLLIACANLASALLSRSISRRKEFAVRVALGAGRSRLIQQLLTESTILAVIGGAVGLLLAAGMLFFLRARALPVLPIHAQLSLDLGAVLVTGVLALCTGVFFGLAPAFSASRLNAQATLRDETRGASESTRSHHLRGALVAGQIALCASLLAGAGLMARSLWQMTTMPMGFDPDGVLTASVRLPPRTYPTPEVRARFLEQLIERLRVLPGVETVATATSIPTVIGALGGVGSVRFTIEGVAASDAEPLVLFSSVSDDYFRTLRIPLRQGRTFDGQDHSGAPPTVVINQSMARRYWPGGDAVGARIRFSADSNDSLLQIVGIVGDVRNDLARPDAEPIVYVSSRQAPEPRVRVLLRTHSDPLALVRPVERELAALDRGLPLQEPITLHAVINERLAARRLPSALMATFGALALLLASIGVYAMFANMAVAREREFGVRMALGSRPHAIAGLMVRQGTGWMAAGVAGGAIGTMLMLRLLRRLLDEVPPFDPIALGMAVAIMVGCASVALLIPVRRATRVDPIVALRAS